MPIRVSHLLRVLRQDRRGYVAALLAITLPVLLAIAGLGVDLGWWYTVKRQNQSAADAAALSAAYEIVAGNTDNATSLTPAASGAAKGNGYAGDTPVVTFPCCNGDPLVPNGSQGVEVVLRQPQNTWFASLASLSSVTIANRAVALVNILDNPCILALGSNSPPLGPPDNTVDDTINLQGNPTISAPDCSIVSDSTSSSAFHIQGSVSITADTLITPGEIDNTGKAFTLTLNKPAQTGANYIPDPYAPPTCPNNGATCLSHTFLTAGMPTSAKPCTGSTKGKVTIYSPPNCYVKASTFPKNNIVLPANTRIDASGGGWGIKGIAVDLTPGGTYWITDGDLQLGPGGGGSTLGCSTCVPGTSGVTVILTTAQASGGTVGSVTLDSLANLNLTAPSSGSFAGLALIQDSNGLPSGVKPDSPNNAQANATETVSGLVYFPQSAITFQGTPQATGPQCLLLVANTIQLQGNPKFATNGCKNFGVPGLPEVKTVSLVE